MDAVKERRALLVVAFRGMGWLNGRESLVRPDSESRKIRERLSPPQEEADSALLSFADLWKQTAGPTAPCNYPPGIRFVEQGSRSSDVYFVQSGLIKLQALDRSGRETIVAVRRRGSLIGFEAAIMCKPNWTSAVTVTGCWLLRFPARQFCELIRRHADLSWRVHQISASELRETTAALVELKSQTASIRLKRLVLELLTELDDSPGQQHAEMRLPLKDWEIAQILGITPEHLSRLRRRLEKEGFLDRKAPSC